MRTLARTCYVHRRLVLLGWIVALVGVTVIHGAVGSSYSDNFKLPHTQSFDAVRLLQRNAPKASGDTEQLVIGARQGKVTDAAVRSQAEAVLSQVARLGQNPIPLIIPCHRVVATTHIGGYSGGDGLPTKRWLLALENTDGTLL